MEEKYIKTLQETRGNFLVFRRDEVALSSGRIASRDMVLHPGAVAVLAVTPQNEIIMVRQYRYPIKRVTYEIPAGKLEKGEEPLVTAQRELEEETGYRAKKWEKLTAFYTAPGFADEVIHLYLAEDLEEFMSHPDPDEIIEFEKISLKAAYEKVLKGEINDSKSLIAILWLVDKVKG